MQNKDKSPYNEKGQRHGCWEWYYKGTKELMLRINYVNDEPYGCMECFGFAAQKEDYEYYAR